ncbi:MAG: PEGA domain-containing protein [Bdellovibrionota bacterium]
MSTSYRAKTISLLMASLLVTPSWTWAQDNPPAAQGPTSPVKVLVDDVYAQESMEKYLPLARSAMFEAFSQMPKANLIRPNVVAREKEKLFVRPQAKADQDPYQKLLAGRKALEAGKQAYHQFNYKNALEYLLTARQQFILNLHHLTSNRELIEAHIYLGMTYMAQQKQFSDENEKQTAENSARVEFERVVYLDPQKQLQGSQYSPEVTAEFGQVKQNLQKKGLVRVQIETSERDAKLFLNGRFLGQSPKTLQLIPGEYFLMAEKEGFQKWYGTKIFKNPVEDVVIELPSDGAKAVLASLFQIREGGDQTSLEVQDLQLLAQKTSTHFVVLTNLENAMGEYRLLGQLYDAKLNEFSQVAIANIGSDVSQMRNASFDLAFTLMGFIRPDGKLINTRDDLARADLTVGKGGRAESQNQDSSTSTGNKAIYKKWWFWVGIAAVGAGGYFVIDGISHSKSGLTINNNGNF